MSTKREYTLRRVVVPPRKYTPVDYPTDDELPSEDLENMSSSDFITDTEEREEETSSSLSGFIVSDDDEGEAEDTLLKLRAVLDRKRPVYIPVCSASDDEGEDELCSEENDSFYYEEEEDETWDEPESGSNSDTVPEDSLTSEEA